MTVSVAPAAAEKRTLSFFNTHTKETLTVTFKRNGRYDRRALEKLNWFLRDWRRDEKTKMDPELFDLVWTVYRKIGARKPIWVVSGYRSPVTNNMLRKRSRGVAKFSQHTRGKAMDFYIPGANLRKLRETALKMQVGGVGYYPRSKSPFVHFDTGRVRHWPRMTRKQLVRLFPNGRTLHIPSDGKPLKGYKRAVAEAKTGKRKNTRLAYASSTRRVSRSERRTAPVGREGDGSGVGFFAALFNEDNRKKTAEKPKKPARKQQQELRSYPRDDKPGKITIAKSTTPAPRKEPAKTPAKKDSPVRVARLSEPETPQTPPTTAFPETRLAALPRPAAKPEGTADPADTAATTAEAGAAESSAVPDMAIAGDSVPLPQSNPNRLVAVAETPGSADDEIAAPLPPQKPLVVASIAGGPDDRSEVATPMAPALPAIDDYDDLHHEEPEPADLPPTLEAAPLAATEPDPKRRALPVLAYDGSRLNTLTSTTPAKARLHATFSHPIVAVASVFKAPNAAIDNRFGAGADDALPSGHFAGPAIKAVKTVWLQ